MDKSPDAFRTISEVAADLDLPQHVLRFWETRFVQIKPLKRGGGRRYYRPDDIELLKGIRHLLYGEGYTIRGVQRILKEQGVRFVQEVWQEGAPQPPPAAGGGRWEAEPAFDRHAAETAAETWAPDADDTPPFDVAAPHWGDVADPAAASGDAPVRPHRIEVAFEEIEVAFTPDDAAVADEPAPAAEPARVPTPAAPAVPRTPFAIGRATPIDPAIALGRAGLEAARAHERDELATASRPAPVEATPRLRAERIAGFTAAPMRAAPEPLAHGRSVEDPVEARPNGAAPAPASVSAPALTPMRLPAGIRPAPAPEPRGGLGHLLDRLRPANHAGIDPVETAAPLARGGGALSRDEIRRLQSTLFELLECKRILDQAR